MLIRLSAPHQKYGDVDAGRSGGFHAAASGAKWRQESCPQMVTCTEFMKGSFKGIHGKMVLT